MGLRLSIWLIFICIPSTCIRSDTDNQDVTALLALKQLWQNVPPSWNRVNDSCGGQWEGITCRGSRVISVKLSSMGLIGVLPGDIQGLSELETLDLSYNKGLSGNLPLVIGKLSKLTNLILAGCNFNGEIPDTIGSLSELVFLSLNSNSFSGTIPQSIGNLVKLYWLDLSANKFTGTIPVSNGITPGLDMLVHAKYFNFGRNQLFGEIPPQLLNENMNLLNLFLDNNQFTGTIPAKINLVRTLEVMLLSNNKLAGLIPDLTGMTRLSYLDMSNNSFEVSGFPPWINALPSLTTLLMEQSHLEGVVPTAFFGLPQLQKVVLKNNKLSGMLDLGAEHSSQLQHVDLQYNDISAYDQRPADKILQLILIGNPVCTDMLVEQSRCILPLSSPSYSTPRNCQPAPCASNEPSSPSCHCAYPYSGTLTFGAPQFSNMQNFTYYAALEQTLMDTFHSNKVSVDSVSLSSLSRDPSNYLNIALQIFPLGQDRFDRTAILTIGFMLSSQTFQPPSYYGPFTFIADEYTTFSDGSGSESKSKSRRDLLAIIGGSIGAVISMILAFFGARHCYVNRCCIFSLNKYGKTDLTNNNGSNNGNNNAGNNNGGINIVISMFNFRKAECPTNSGANNEVRRVGIWSKWRGYAVWKAFGQKLVRDAFG